MFLTFQVERALSQPRQMLRILCGLLCGLVSAAAFADIYGYVDERGVAHLSHYPVDSRYFLFRRQVSPTITPPPASGTTEDMPVAGAGSGAHLAASGFAELPAAASGKPFAALITQVAREHNIDASLVHAVVAAESGFDPRARSPKGASGLMQLMPETAQRYGVADIWNPLENLRGGVRYLKDLLRLFKQNVSLALAAYNAGEGAVIGAGHAIPPYRETRSYVPKVLQRWEQLRTQAAASQ